MSGWSEDHGRDQRRLLSLEPHLRTQYRLAVACIAVLAVTGLPQKFESFSLCRQLIDLAGGIETLRLVHHVAGGVLVLTGVYHVVLVLAAVLVVGETAPLRMIPRARDFRDAVRGTAHLLGLEGAAPGGNRSQYMQKLDYWFIAWALAVMAVTGLVSLTPLRAATVLSTETVLALLRTHSDAAPLVLVWILLVHLPSTDFTPRLFGGRALAAASPHEAAARPEAPGRAAAVNRETEAGVAAKAELRLGELRAKDREGSP